MIFFKKNSATLYLFLGITFNSVAQLAVDEDAISYSTEIDCPTELLITPLDECGDYQFTLGEGQSGEDVYWYFDDGSYLDHVSFTETHHYSSHGTYSGYAQYTSDVCSTTTYNFLVIVPNCFSTVGMDETIDSSIEIYPNPVSNILFVNVHESEPKSFCIYNSIGKLVVTEVLIGGVNKIDISKLDLGIYIVVYRSDSEYAQERLIVK